MTDRSAPARLRAGDTVGLIAPAGPLPAADLDAGVALLQAWGLRVLCGQRLRAVHPSLDYLAGTDAERAADLHDVWCAPGVRALFCARGGYGCLRIADLLDTGALRAAGPRLLVGSSDATVLHEQLGAALGVRTVLGPMPVTTPFLSEPQAREHLRRALFEPEPVTLRGDPAGGGPHGTVSGTTVGGNASVLAATLGAPGHLPPPPGSIALLEDVTESPYRLDRILTQLVRARWFDGVTGIGIGSFHDCGDPAVVRAAVTSVLGPLGLPVVWDLGFGHCPDQHTVPLGAPATLDAGAGTLTVEPAVG